MSNENVQSAKGIGMPVEIGVSFGSSSVDLISDLGVECTYDEQGTLSYQTWFQTSTGGGPNYYEKLVDLYRTKGFEEFLGEEVEKYKPREPVDFGGVEKTNILFALAELAVNRPMPEESGRIKVDAHPRELLDHIKENDPFNQVLSSENLKRFENMVVEFEGSVEAYNKELQANNTHITNVQDDSEVILRGQNPSM